MSIALRQEYSLMLDKVYQKSSLTSVLDGNNELAALNMKAGTLQIPKISLDGMADYSKANGYSSGSVSLSYESVACNYDRGRMFNVDAVDNEETAGIAFGQIAGEFERTKVAPELDAFRFSKYATAAGTANNIATGTLSTGAGALSALRTAKDGIENAEADLATCYLFINPVILGMIEDLDTTKSRAALEGWAGIVKVPAARFYKTVTLGNNGFSGATAINFIIVDKNAVIQYQKHAVTKIITPEQNQTADAWKYGFRTVGVADVFDNKTNGLYAHTVTPAQQQSTDAAAQG